MIHTGIIRSDCPLVLDNLNISVFVATDSEHAKHNTRLFIPFFSTQILNECRDLKDGLSVSIPR